MDKRLRIRFAGSKERIRRSWVPVLFEMRLKGSKETTRHTVRDFDKNIKDDPARGDSYFEIRNLDQGTYELKVQALHTGKPILHKATLTFKEKEKVKDHEIGTVTKELNVRGLDVVADAPYRLEKSYAYLPLIVFMKDISKPGKIEVHSIRVFVYSTSSGGRYVPVDPGSIYEVIDKDGTRVEENGKPALLRFDVGKNYESVTTDPWYRMIFLHRDQLEATTGKHLIYKNARYIQYKVQVEYTDGGPRAKQFTFRTLLPDSDLPRVEGWYYGDNHYHSEFTDNPAEYGGPLSMTAKVAKAVGFSWVTVTDHSYCLSHPPGDETPENRWISYKKAVQKTNDDQKDVLLCAAEEITFKRPIIGLHLLSFGNPFVEDMHPAGFGSLSFEEVLQKITGDGDQAKGFVFAAHPASSGYVWEDSHYDIATRAKWGNVFAGLQVFNEKIAYRCTTRLSAGDQSLEPFDLLNEKSRQRPWSKELQEGLKNHWVRRFLLPPLQECKKTGRLRKYAILAGSDAHMDFNYSLRPDLPFLLAYLNDNAFGKARTLAYLPKENGEALTEENLYDAMRKGRALLTDGPVVLFQLRVEGEDRVYRFGETVTLAAGKDLEISFEWHSTAEFGPVQRIDLILGTPRGEKNVAAQIPFPSLRKKETGFDGRLTHVFTDWTEEPCYLRLQAASMIDSTGEALFGCVSNPIWIVPG